MASKILLEFIITLLENILKYDKKFHNNNNNFYGLLRRPDCKYCICDLCASNTIT